MKFREQNYRIRFSIVKSPETNQIKLDELKQKQADVRQKAEIAKADRQASAQGAVDTFSTALDSLNEIEQSPGLSKAVGIRSAFPTVLVLMQLTLKQGSTPLKLKLSFLWCSP